ncbi:MAG: hypothetical protein Tsb0021_16440 [Chlamydiales bacterium]
MIKHKGTHTWDIYLDYHRCPKCGYIIEDRQTFYYSMGQDLKDLMCPRCKKTFTIKKRGSPRIGPIFGS